MTRAKIRDEIAGGNPFRYTDRERAEIQQSLRHLTSDEVAIGEALKRLETSVAWIQGGLLSRKERRDDMRRWAKIAKLATDAQKLLRQIDSEHQYFPHHSLALQELHERATYEAAPRGVRRLTPQCINFQFDVLECWVWLGGTLGRSCARTGKTTGPLARYFSAATGPVMGGSLENLRDIVARHRPKLGAVWRRGAEKAAAERGFRVLDTGLDGNC